MNRTFWEDKFNEHFKTAEVILKSLQEDGRTSTPVEVRIIRAARADAHARLAEAAVARMVA